MDRFWVLVALADFVILGAVTAVPLAFDFRIVFGSHFFRPNALVILTIGDCLRVPSRSALSSYAESCAVFNALKRRSPKP